MELDSRKKSKRDRMMHSKSFETQVVREIGQKKAGESRGFPILWMAIIEDIFQMEGKECSPGKIENVKKIHARARKMLQYGIGNSGPVAVEEEKLEAATRNSAEEQKDE